MALKPRELVKNSTYVYYYDEDDELDYGLFCYDIHHADGNDYTLLNIHISDDDVWEKDVLAIKEGSYYRIVPEEKWPLAYKNGTIKKLIPGEYKVLSVSNDIYEVISLNGDRSSLLEKKETRSDENDKEYIIARDLRSRYYVFTYLPNGNVEVLNLDKLKDEDLANELKDNVDLVIWQYQDYMD